jgi:predicted AAA+ superfamily ATPase
MIYPRFLTEVLRQRRDFYPVVLLIGPRQSGKTTLTKKLGAELGIGYSSFDDLNNLISVQMDPIGFLNTLNKPIILDEVQRAPELFLPIKVDVDNNRIPGRYMLTGSANPLVVPKLGDALTGRMALCTMWPLSRGEIVGIRGTFLDDIFTETSWDQKYSLLDQETLIKMLFIGGFPALNNTTDEQYRRNWCNDYISLALQKDINDLSKIEGLAHLPALLHGLAARVGSTHNLEALACITKTAGTTVRRYIQLIESLFLLYRLPAWGRSIDKRLVKSSKIYFSDTALLLHVLNLNAQQLQSTPDLLGRIFENFVVMECVKQATWSKQSPTLSHYRQEGGKGTEVDIILESFGKIVGIEIKLSSIIRADDVKGLKSLKDLVGDAFYQGIILYMGDKVLSLGEKLYAIPVSALWEKI